MDQRILARLSWIELDFRLQFGVRSAPWIFIWLPDLCSSHGKDLKLWCKCYPLKSLRTNTVMFAHIPLANLCHKAKPKINGVGKYTYCKVNLTKLWKDRGKIMNNIVLYHSKEGLPKEVYSKFYIKEKMLIE